MEIKDIDGQRSLKIEVTEDLPGSVFITGPRGLCMEFDRGVLLNAARRMDTEFTSA